jgi:hypothetical protein
MSFNHGDLPAFSNLSESGIMITGSYNPLEEELFYHEPTTPGKTPSPFECLLHSSQLSANTSSEPASELSVLSTTTGMSMIL